MVVSYSSNERCFVRPLLEQCLKFSDDVVVAYGSHFYDGTPEDMRHIQELREAYTPLGVSFAMYRVDAGTEAGRPGVRERPTAYWHNLSRWTGLQASRKDTSFVFLIDADEIPEGDRVRDWLATARLDPTRCYKNACYWYFKQPVHQATTLEDSILLVPRKLVSDPTNVFGDMERDHTVDRSGTPPVRMVKGSDGQPMWHHFSWVRSREGMMRKVRTWAHANDAFHGDRVDVDAMVASVFANDGVNDVVHGYDYRTVHNTFGVRL